MWRKFKAWLSYKIALIFIKFDEGLESRYEAKLASAEKVFADIELRLKQDTPGDYRTLLASFEALSLVITEFDKQRLQTIALVEAELPEVKGRFKTCTEAVEFLIKQYKDKNKA